MLVASKYALTAPSFSKRRARKARKSAALGDDGGIEGGIMVQVLAFDGSVQAHLRVRGGLGSAGRSRGERVWFPRGGSDARGGGRGEGREDAAHPDSQARAPRLSFSLAKSA